MSPVPPPRPALRRPGAIKAAKRAAAKQAPQVKATASGKTGTGKPGTGLLDGKLVQFVVPLPKDVRRRVKEKAEQLGVTPEEAVYRVLLSWVEG